MTEWCMCSHSYQDHCSDSGSYISLCVWHDGEGCHCHSFKSYTKGLTSEVIVKKIIAPLDIRNLEPAF